MAKLNETKIPMTDFLEAYRHQPCLYNSMLETYKNRAAREEAYEAMIRSLKIPHLSVLDIKLKIKSVRTVYTKELRILTREKELNRFYEPKLFWFKRADSFLRTVSLSHCKRQNNCTNAAAKKGAPQKMLFNAANELIEDAMHEEEDESESGEQIDSSYVNDLDEHRTKSNATTSTIPPPNASCQTTEDLGSCISSAALTRTPNKTELMIDDSSICIVDQQQQQPTPHQQPTHQQQQQTAQRKSKYMPYAQSHQLQSQQQVDLSTSSNPNHCFTGPNGTVTNSDDDLCIFGQSVASQLRTIPDPYSRSVAKLRIQQVLFEAETGQSSEAVSPHLQNF